MPTVTFLPSFRKVGAQKGMSILEAAQAAGLHMNVVCGGQGKCGKCIVYLKSGRATFESGAFGKFFTDDELTNGACLACQT
ncbi:MAG: 2Fe-2S iron-sulfur cluster-binding protein, partial [Methanoregulaceae archaeon]|nr:2Fe-2S iron-sulfur cluster-binding protein [Methanoregulaceae archaeon]